MMRGKGPFRQSSLIPVLDTWNPLRNPPYDRLRKKHACLPELRSARLFIGIAHWHSGRERLVSDFAYIHFGTRACVD